MNTKSEQPANEIKFRLIAPIQTRGGIGKSTEAIARCAWMDRRSVTWRAFDLDRFNHSLSTAYTSKVKLVKLGNEPEGELVNILRAVQEADVTMLDPSAHMNKLLLRVLQLTDFTKFAKYANVRATVMVYPIDELTDMEDITDTVMTLTNQVDWIVVRNSARIPTTRFFDGSRLEGKLKEFGALFLDIPVLLADTRIHIRVRETQLQRGLSPQEIIEDKQIDLLHKVVYENWLEQTLFARFDAIAKFLVPDALAAKIVKPLAQAPVEARKWGEMINTEGM